MDGDKATIPYIAHEGALARMERTTSRLFKVIVVLIIALFLSNALWLYAWTRYDYTSDATVTVDGKDGIANYIGNDGDITNGEGYSEENTHTDTQK